MPFRPRPIRRVAVTGAVGAAAYNAGKNKNAGSTKQAAEAPPAQAVPAAPQEAAPSKAEVYEAIAKLGELKEKGLLSDEEFQREKVRLLDS